MRSSLRVLLTNQGCSANTAEGEMMGGLLAKAGHTVSHTEKDPATLVLNLCTVKGNASALQAVAEARSQHPKIPIVVAGCVTPDLVRDLQQQTPGVSILTTHTLEKVVETVETALAGQPQVDLHRPRAPRPALPRVRQNPLVGILVVESGCLDACTFCSTRLVKGRLRSVDPAQVIEEAQQAIADGCRELWITGQDASCYGFDLGTDLAQLLQRLLVQVRGDYRIRVGMGNPRHLLRYASALAEVFWEPRLYQFLHLPVQSGSDRILAAMGRQHSAQDYRDLVALFRTQNSLFTVSTDIIVGFPGETEGDFQQTLDLITTTQPSVVHRTRFVPRPGTAAARLPQNPQQGGVSKAIKHERTRKLTDLYIQVAAANNQNWLGWEGRVLVMEAGKHNTWVARTPGYRPIVLRGSLHLGQEVHVRITGLQDWHLEGTLLPSPPRENL